MLKMMKNVVFLFTLFVLVLQCSSVPTLNHERAEMDIGSFFDLLNKIRDPCASEPCQNGGICVATEDHFKCLCLSPYFGDTCSEDPCTPNPCHNEGECSYAGEGFRCDCKSPFRGETCKLDPCAPNPCENDGRCELIDDSFYCSCKNPYRGNTCELGPCAPNPCENGGKCEEDGESFKCTCETPFQGETCEQSPCTPNPCHNNGKCFITRENDFACLCKEPFKGERCDEGPCTPNPCQNGGNCTIFGNDARCLCHSAYFGEYCQKDLCSSNPCKNDGICKLDGNSFKCECKPPYKGKECENEDRTKLEISTTTSSDFIMTRNITSQNNTETTDIYNWISSETSIFTSDENATTTKSESSTTVITSTTLEQGNKTEPGISTTSSDSIMTRNTTSQNNTDSTDSSDWISSETSMFTSDEEATTTADESSTNITILEQGSCETDSDCLNGGTCNKVKEHVCDCAKNFGGIRCEVNLPCIGLDQSCRIMNAVCLIVDNRAICECPNGTLYHRKSGLCEDICDARKCLNGKCEIIGKTYKCNCNQGYTGNHCDEKDRGNHENFVPWFTVIASINLFIAVLLILMFCTVCHIKRFITSA